MRRNNLIMVPQAPKPTHIKEYQMRKMRERERDRERERERCPNESHKLRSPLKYLVQIPGKLLP